MPPVQAQTVQLAKTSQGGTGTFDFALDNLADASDSITTASPGSTVASAQVSAVVDPATAVTIGETATPAFTLASASCTDLNAATTGNPADFGTLAGNTLVIAPAFLLPGAQIVCTFTNRLVANISITKAAAPIAARTGEVVAYTLTAANAGPGDVAGVLLRDSPDPAGLDCTAGGAFATCVASGAATCPAAVPVAALVGAGVSIPNLPAGSQVQVTLQCVVTAAVP